MWTSSSSSSSSSPASVCFKCHRLSERLYELERNVSALELRVQVLKNMDALMKFELTSRKEKIERLQKKVKELEEINTVH